MSTGPWPTLKAGSYRINHVTSSLFVTTLCKQSTPSTTYSKTRLQPSKSFLLFVNAVFEAAKCYKMYKLKQATSDTQLTLMHLTSAVQCEKQKLSIPKAMSSSEPSISSCPHNTASRALFHQAYSTGFQSDQEADSLHSDRSKPF